MDIKLKDFEGPLDLLLHLVSKYQMDIYDVPITEVIEQYLAYVSTLQAMRLEVTGEYMVMASQLMLIKSRKLLPKVAEVTDLEDDLEQDLLSQIEEYRKFKLLGEHLEAKHQERAQYYSKAPTELIYEDAELVHDKTTIDLFLAFSNFIISIGANADSVMTIKFWTMGSLAGSSWAHLTLPTVVVGVAFLFFSTQYRVFNAMMMGDEAALTLGIPLRFYWYLYVAIVAVMTAVLVSTCGIIGFVGLITPHLARSLVGTNYRRLFPIATLLGALFVVWADVLARVLIQNAELPIGIFTALVGAPFFIYMVASRRREVRV